MGRRAWLIGFVTVGVVSMTAIFAVDQLTGGGAESGLVKGPPGNPFTIERPSGWRELSSTELDALPGSRLAVLRRKDGRGILIINKQTSTSHDFAKISSDLDSALTRSVPDFKKVSSHTVGVKAGNAFHYSYIRTRKGTANSVVVVPVNSGRYTINVVVTGGAKDVARQVGAMIRSFDA
jgi:hypothetical protein